MHLFVDYKNENPLETERESLASTILTNAILAIAFAVTGWLAFVGIIFSCITINNINEYESKFGKTVGKAAVGNGMVKGALPYSIVVTCTLFVYVLL